MQFACILPCLQFSRFSQAGAVLRQVVGSPLPGEATPSAPSAAAGTMEDDVAEIFGALDQASGPGKKD
jgi:hypothetical protein